MKPTKTFRWLLIIMLCSPLIVNAASAAKKVDFSGKWVLNETKSNLGEGNSFSALKMTVTQDGNSITIERTRTGRDGQERTSSETLTLDGKENVAESDNRNTTTVASWSEDGTTLTIKSKSEFSRQGETFVMNRTETWTLDGKTLNIQSDSSSSRGDRSAKLVYDKE